MRGADLHPAAAKFVRETCKRARRQRVPGAHLLSVVRARHTPPVKRLSILALLFFLLAPSLADAGAVVHLRRWRWVDIAANMQAIRDAGYTAILISPHTATCGGGFSDGYDPSDFTSFTSRFGTGAELGSMIQTAHNFGVQVYADMVLNHMCATNYSYPRFGWNDFHHNGGISDWNNQWQVENGDLFGLNDLAHESGYVRSELFNFVVATNNLGMDGYRWDAAKHVPIWFWRDHVVNNVNGWGKFNFGEVYSADRNYVQPYVDTGMAVTDFALYDAILAAFRFGGDLRVLDGAGYAAVNGPRAVTFVENHDVGPPQNRMLAYAFLAAYVGYPIFYDVSLNDAVMNNLVWIHNNKAHGNYYNRYKDQNVLIFERDHNLLAGINQSGNWAGIWVYTSWNNTRLHDYSGHSADIWTDSAGWTQVWIPPGSYVMLAP